MDALEAASLPLIAVSQEQMGAIVSAMMAVGKPLTTVEVQRGGRTALVMADYSIVSSVDAASEARDIVLDALGIASALAPLLELLCELRESVRREATLLCHNESLGIQRHLVQVAQIAANNQLRTAIHRQIEPLLQDFIECCQDKTPEEGCKLLNDLFRRTAEFITADVQEKHPAFTLLVCTYLIPAEDTASTVNVQFMLSWQNGDDSGAVSVVVAWNTLAADKRD